MGTGPLLSIARWVAVLPGAIAGNLLGGFVMYFVVSSVEPSATHDMASSEGFAGHYIFGPVYAVFLSIARAGGAAAAAYWIAPRHKGLTVIVLASIWACICAVGLTFSITAAIQGEQFWEVSIRETLQSVPGCIGAFIFGFGLRDEEMKKLKAVAVKEQPT